MAANDSVGVKPIEVIDLVDDDDLVEGDPSPGSDTEIEIIVSPPKKFEFIDLVMESIASEPQPGPSSSTSQNILTGHGNDVDSDVGSVCDSESSEILGVVGDDPVEWDPSPGSDSDIEAITPPPKPPPEVIDLDLDEESLTGEPEPSSSTSQNVPTARGNEVDLESDSSDSGTIEIERLEVSPAPRYRPKVMISEGIFTDDELDNLLRADKLEVQVLDNLVPESSIQFRHVRPIEDYRGATDMDELILLHFQIAKHLAKFRAQIPRFRQQSSESLASWIKDIKDYCPDKKIILLVQGENSYLSQIPWEEQVELTRNMTATHKGIDRMPTGSPNISRLEIEYVLEKLENKDIILDFRHFETASQLARMVKEYANYRGELYDKKARKQAQDLPNSDGKPIVLVDGGNVPFRRWN